MPRIRRVDDRPDYRREADAIDAETPVDVPDTTVYLESVGDFLIYLKEVTENARKPKRSV
jgi:hypothetical protein